jgi:hypothetical protein
LRLKVVQRSDYTPDQIWILDDVPVTNALPWKIERHEQRQVGGKQVDLLGFAGFARSTAASSHEVVAGFAAPPREEGTWITFVDGHDDQDRILSHADQSYVGPHIPWSAPPRPGQSTVIYSFSVSPPPGAKKLTLRFAVHQARSVDFLVKPTFKK